MADESPQSKSNNDNDVDNQIKKKKNKKRPNRRRRNKKDVILDFTKRRNGSKMTTETPSEPPRASTNVIKKGKFETTGQYFRRIDRLVAIAKVEANLETRFDVSISKKPDK